MDGENDEMKRETVNRFPVSNPEYKVRNALDGVAWWRRLELYLGSIPKLFIYQTLFIAQTINRFYPYISNLTASPTDFLFQPFKYLFNNFFPFQKIILSIKSIHYDWRK